MHTERELRAHLRAAITQEVAASRTHLARERLGMPSAASSDGYQGIDHRGYDPSANRRSILTPDVATAVAGQLEELLGFGHVALDALAMLPGTPSPLAYIKPRL
jgi:hypothetical protein